MLIALHHNGDIRRMGSLKRFLPITTATMLVGWLAISGVPFLSGFWSKEAILLSVQGSRVVAWVPALFWIGLLTALLTALYMTRMMWLVFFARSQHDPHHRPERERYFVVLAVLVLLAIGSVVFGWFLPSEKAFHELGT